MIKANELRIGNMLTHNDVVITVNTIGDFFTGINEWSDMSMSGSIRYNELNPIPLTEEWLIKMGFEKYDANIGLIDKFKTENNYSYKMIGFGDYSIIRNDIEILGEHPGYFVKIKYVHQLQNLYFALTGEELTIKQ